MTRLILLTLLFLVVAPVAFAQQCQIPKCGPYLAVTEAIAKCFGEVPMMTGILGDGQRRFVMFVDPADTSWTIGELTTNGLFCITGTGSALDTEPMPKRGSPS